MPDIYRPVMPNVKYPASRRCSRRTLRGPLATALALATSASVLFSSPAASASPALQLIVQPAAGIAPIDQILGHAARSVDLTMYELVDTTTEQLLAAEAARGVKVRVLLDRNGEGQSNSPAYGYLSAHGVAVRWAPSRFDRTHEKAAVIDGHEALVMTMNLVTSDYPGTRDYAVVDTQPADVAAIETVFNGDWNGGSGATPTGRDLIWSPGAESGLVALIDGAHHQLLVENEEMNDRYITGPLEQAARRGVNVEVVMTADSEWASAFDELAAAGVHVRTYASNASLYIHAKAVVADAGAGDERAFVGSQNFSIASLVYNRELGIVSSAASLITPLAGTIRSDFTGAQQWK